MKASAWSRLENCLPDVQTAPWLESMLSSNANCAYLEQFGAPTRMESFRNQVPIIDYDQLEPWINRIAAGESSLLFSGKPVAFEKTSGNSGDIKLIPYTEDGLNDFRRALLPWLSDVVNRHHITGSAYFSLSPACRTKEYVSGIPVGLSDVAYIGEKAGAVIAEVFAVPPSLGDLSSHSEWKKQTLYSLEQTKDLELISAWSPTFLLHLFDGKDTEKLWPDLKVISCWACGASAEFAHSLKVLFPHVCIEPKGLMSTEAVITIPDIDGKPVLTDAGFFEFRYGKNTYLEYELEQEHEYEVIVTTASGLYRYCTGDMVRYGGRNHDGRAILRFIGRWGLVSDLVGEKLTESFVASCLKGVSGFRMLVPSTMRDRYVLIVDEAAYMGFTTESVEAQLMRNPQYAYARKLGQLKPLTIVITHNPWQSYERHQTKQGVRLGDVKAVALRGEQHWDALFRGLT